VRVRINKLLSCERASDAPVLSLRRFETALLGFQ